MKAKQKKEIKKNPNDWIKSAALFFWQVFHVEYPSPVFKQELLAGGCGCSMFGQSWVFASKPFVKTRISGKARVTLEKDGYLLDNIPHGYISTNKKGSDNRKAVGQKLHRDHSPGNREVVRLIRNKVKSYGSTSIFADNEKDLCDFIKNVQTLDIITVEQDDLRTCVDDKYTKEEKCKFNHQQRDDLLNDIWEIL